jgi:hypothetical protein
MMVSGTAPNGVAGAGTRLRFSQVGNRVLGRYSGGRVVRGCLAGRVEGAEFRFRYLQREGSGELHAGRSHCDVQWLGDGRLRLIEHFAWSTRVGSGVNVFEELPSDGPA